MGAGIIPVGFIGSRIGESPRFPMDWWDGLLATASKRAQGAALPTVAISGVVWLAV